jgi:acetyl esterase/lipase
MKDTAMTQQQRQALDDLVRRGPLDVGGDLADQRAIFHDMIASVPLPDDVSTTPGELGGVPVVTVETPGSGPSAVLLYFHGGAYALGSAADSAGLAQPSSAVVLSPWADLTLSGDSVVGKADVDPALTAQGLRTRARDYLGQTNPTSPLASPIFADLTGLAPLLIQVGSHEILLDDAVRLAARAARHDVPVQLQVWPQVPHVFQGFAALLDEADTALRAAAAFTQAHWAVQADAVPVSELAGARDQSAKSSVR